MYYVYILTNRTDKVMYIGVTNDLKRRLYEHKNELVDGFTKRYHVHKLVYYEMYKEVTDAIAREKKLKSLLRIKKNALVESMNPSWVDLSEKLFPNTFVHYAAPPLAFLLRSRMTPPVSGEGEIDNLSRYCIF